MTGTYGDPLLGKEAVPVQTAVQPWRLEGWMNACVLASTPCLLFAQF